MKKKCPWRKITITDKINKYNVVIEEFGECYEKLCPFYSKVIKD